jgi:hypothetical protein
MDYEWTAAESSHGTVSNLSSGGDRDAIPGKASGGVNRLRGEC